MKLELQDIFSLPFIRFFALSYTVENNAWLFLSCNAHFIDTANQMLQLYYPHPIYIQLKYI